jgi:hypothetical protein
MGVLHGHEASVFVSIFFLFCDDDDDDAHANLSDEQQGAQVLKEKSKNEKAVSNL